jgi:chemotaxis protein methyltransferase CheR
MHDPLFEREFEFSERDFERVRRLIRRHAGISLSPGKHHMVYSRLARRLRARGIASFAAYLDALETDGASERQDFINALTTNLTGFWREPHHFPVLAEHLRRRAAQGAERIELWCCAASTGEEPYTIAITAMQAFSSFAPPVQVLATDIDTQVLETARRGVYPAEAVAAADPELARRYFQRLPDGAVRVRPEVAALVTFRPLNLLERGWPLRGAFAAVFCRNVMIYFDKPTQRAVLERIAPLLEGGGLLFAGHSESFADAKRLFRLRGRTVYERLANEANDPDRRLHRGN